MSLPSLALLPAALNPLAERALNDVESALGELGETLAGWPASRREQLLRVLAQSDFVLEQIKRDPTMFAALLASGELERALAPGELRTQLAALVAECADEEALSKCLRRYRNRQQLRIIWRWAGCTRACASSSVRRPVAAADCHSSWWCWAWASWAPSS